MKILLADDEAAARYGMSRALQSAGREILEASDGNEALEIIREKAPDLVFLDLNMPKCDGLTVLANLREKPDAPMPEIIVVTANDSIICRGWWLLCGCTGTCTRGLSACVGT